MNSNYDQLGELSLPIINICEGMLSLYPISKYFPLFLHILNDLNEFSRSIGLYIPIVKDAMFTLLNSKEFSKKKSNKKPKAFDFEINIKVQKEYSQTNAFWNSAFNEILDILVDFLSIHSKKIYFPELVCFIHYNLKKLQKAYSFNFYKTKIKLFLQKIQVDQEKVFKSRNKSKLSVSKISESLQFCCKGKSILQADFGNLQEEKENLKKQKILAEKEENEKSSSDESENGEESNQNSFEEDNNEHFEHESFGENLDSKPLSEEDLDLD